MFGLKSRKNYKNIKISSHANGHFFTEVIFRSCIQKLLIPFLRVKMWYFNIMLIGQLENKSIIRVKMG